MSTTSASSDSSSGATPTSNQGEQIPSFTNLANLISIKLDGENYLAWKHHIVTILKTMGLLSYLKKDVSPPAEDSANRAHWEKAYSYVYACLNATLSPSIAHIAIGTSSASELRFVIEETYFQQLFAKQMQLRTEFQIMKKMTFQLQANYDKAKQLADSLKAVGDPITDSSLVLQTLHGLNDNFTPIQLNIESSNVLPTFHQVKSKLLTYEGRLSQQEIHNILVSAMAAMTMKPPHQGNPDRSSPDRSVICQICDKVGHRANNCYQLRYPQSQNYRGGGSCGRWRGGNRRGGRNNGNHWSGSQFSSGCAWSNKKSPIYYTTCH
ncbi:uncharacterized protein LOC110875205 [Helianthus annuus]|uniref:uncharacterized protein LOC110875205 n=1 Tax=Helianthus annuus TaxID=4232 RepID=UPI000B8FDA8D|nr:uncharacterized protein LOC110875205 [Helianthus annuus]